jgi:S-adenosylmethionine:tRNA-ribosyltransferase-isomerase (queuine synthetase)
MNYFPIGSVPEGEYGHYEYGAFYVTQRASGGDVFHFLAMWPQSEASVATPNAQLHFNEITYVP